MYVCMYVCMCVCMCMYVCMYDYDLYSKEKTVYLADSPLEVYLEAISFNRMLVHQTYAI